MTGSTTSLDALGLEPFGYHYQKPVPSIIPSWPVIWRTYADPHLRDDGYTETALYSADTVGALLLRTLELAERLDTALRDQLIWHERHDRALSQQPPEGRNGWARMEHQEQIAIIRAALKENTDG